MRRGISESIRFGHGSRFAKITYPEDVNARRSQELRELAQDWKCKLVCICVHACYACYESLRVYECLWQPSDNFETKRKRTKETGNLWNPMNIDWGMECRGHLNEIFFWSKQNHETHRRARRATQRTAQQRHAMHANVMLWSDMKWAVLQWEEVFFQERQRSSCLDSVSIVTFIVFLGFNCADLFKVRDQLIQNGSDFHCDFKFDCVDLVDPFHHELQVCATSKELKT